MKPLELFPLEDGERVSGQGVYHYRENGELTPIVEPWCRHSSAGGGEVTRAMRTDGAHFVLGVKHACAAEYTVTDLVWQNLTNGEQLAAQYRVQADRLQIERRGETSEQPLSEGLLFFPLMRVFTGEVIRGLIAQGGSGQVLVPSIQTPMEANSLFEPLFSERFAEKLSAAPATGPQDCDAYRYGGAQYADGALFWLDAKDLLQQYEWQQSEDSHWQVVLAEYQALFR